MKRARVLLYLDRLFRLPYLLTSWFFPGAPPKTSSGEIVVIKLFGMGSIVRLAALCRQESVDISKITLITFSRNEAICSFLGFKCLPVRTGGFRALGDLLGIFNTVRSLQPEVVIDFERCSNLVSIYRTLLSSRVGCTTVSFELNREVTSKARTIYAVSRLTQEQIFQRGIAFMPKGRTSNLPVSVHNVDSNEVLVNINASGFLPERRYPIDSFAEAIRSIHQSRNDARFFFTGSLQERPYVDQLIAKLKGLPVLNVAGTWNLHEFIHHLTRCALFITCDSGPLHLAAYLRVPSISIWGPTQPGHFGYQATDAFHPITLELDCAPCFVHPLSNPALHCRGRIDCMKNLTPEMVARSAIRVLDTLPATREVQWPANFTRKPTTKSEVHLAQ